MLSEIYKTDGFTGWFAGLVPALVLVMNPAIQFALYDHLRRKVMELKVVRNILLFQMRWQVGLVLLSMGRLLETTAL